MTIYLLVKVKNDFGIHVIFPASVSEMSPQFATIGSPASRSLASICTTEDNGVSKTS